MATKGNIFDHITIENNMVWVDPTLTGIDFNSPILFGNSSAKANFKFDNLKVRNNHIFYNGKAPSVAFAQTGANYVAEGNILTPISKPPASPAATSK